MGVYPHSRAYYGDIPSPLLEFTPRGYTPIMGLHPHDRVNPAIFGMGYTPTMGNSTVMGAYPALWGHTPNNGRVSPIMRVSPMSAARDPRPMDWFPRASRS